SNPITAVLPVDAVSFAGVLHQGSIDIENVDASQYNMADDAVIPSPQSDAVAIFSSLRAGIRQLQIIDLPVLLVLKQQGLFEAALCSNVRLFSSAEGINDDRSPGLT